MGETLSKDLSECQSVECVENASVATEAATASIPEVKEGCQSDADDERTSISPPPSPKQAPRRARRSGHARVAQTPSPAEAPALDTGWGFCTILIPALVAECMHDRATACTVIMFVILGVFLLGFTLGRIT